MFYRFSTRFQTDWFYRYCSFPTEFKGFFPYFLDHTRHLLDGGPRHHRADDEREIKRVHEKVDDHRRSVFFDVCTVGVYRGFAGTLKYMRVSDGSGVKGFFILHDSSKKHGTECITKPSGKKCIGIWEKYS